MKKLLMLYADGIGDCIMATPHMRYYAKEGYEIDLMCRESVKSSHLLDECPYINDLIIVPNPWDSGDKVYEAQKSTKKIFDKKAKKYDDAVYKPLCQVPNIHKIDMTSKFFGMPELKGEDRWPEVFISEENQRIADEFLKEIEFDNFRFLHNVVELHPGHTWNEAEHWCNGNMEEMDIFNAAFKQWDDINISFAVLKRATQTILCSSVYIHAADAMGKRIDVAYYGTIDRKVWPVKVTPRRICEGGSWQ